jgi:epoxide hydrolase 4
LCQRLSGWPKADKTAEISLAFRAQSVTPEPLPYPVTSRDLGELRIELAAAGDIGRPLVILLHGFPDLWQGWHFQIPALTRAGYRVLAPNQRGYGKSDKPVGIASYNLEQLAKDVVALADSEGCSTFSLVGHDWGGIVAWWVAARFPERINRLVILNAPHPGIFHGYLLRRPTQILRSAYVALFQLPWLPEKAFSSRNYELLFRSMKATSKTGVFDESDRRYLVAGWSQPRALTAMLNYYRAAVRRSPASLKLRISPPTLILFGRQDPAEEPGLAEASLPLCDDGRIVWLENAHHWIQREEPERVNQELVEFLSKVAG